ncbi:MAG: cell division protein FtsA [Dehalococcoidales bacterium]|nr:cell division protein FtsA [Dehalococcoidales bacterium]
MRTQPILAAIDVGTTKVCTIIAEVNEWAIQVAGVGIAPSKGLHKGLVVNLNEAKESIRESVRKAEQSSNIKVESAYIGVTGRHINSINNQGVVSITRNDRLVRSDDLKRVLQSAQSIKVNPDQKLLHIIPRGYTVDGQSMVKNPVGMHGFRLDVETHLITATVTSIQNLTKCIQGIGIDVDDLVLEPLASSEAVLTEDEKQVGVVLADIGGGTTDIAIFKDGSIWHTAILPVAGYQLTRDIAIGLGLPFNIAEEMKRKYGSVMPIYESKTATSNAMVGNGHSVSHRDLSDIIRARAEEIIKLILLELPRSDFEKLVPAGLVFTGGSSNLSGIDALGREMLRIPVRVGIPTNIAGISDVLHDPAYATSVGLILWGMKNGGKAHWNSPRVITRLRRLASQLGRLFR